MGVRGLVGDKGKEERGVSGGRSGNLETIEKKKDLTSDLVVNIDGFPLKIFVNLQTKQKRTKENKKRKGKERKISEFNP